MRTYLRAFFPPASIWYTYECNGLIPDPMNYVAVPANIVSPEGGIAVVVRYDGPQSRLDKVEQIKSIWRIVPPDEAKHLLEVGLRLKEECWTKNRSFSGTEKELDNSLDILTEP